MPEQLPRTAFDWSMYADATLAGLSVLVPVPFLDEASESFFRRRITRAVARGRGVTLSDEVLAEISRGGEGCLSGCLMLPLRLTLDLLKRLSRKLLYFLTVKQASEKLSHYWHRAFLIDYMIASGHLETVESARTARMAMEAVLESGPGPLSHMARSVIGRAHHVWRTVRRARDGEEDEVVRESRAEMASRWGEFREYLEGVASHYDAQYQRLRDAQGSTVTRTSP